MPEHALVVGKFAPLHLGHQLVLDEASRVGRLTVIVWSNPDFEDMPNEVRTGWIRALYPSAHVIVGEGGPSNDAPDVVPREYVRDLLARHDLHPDVVFTSESYGPGFAAHLGVQHRQVDLSRARVPISGTRLREDVHTLRSFLDPLVYRHFVELVVFLGAESTGKSTLAQAMAAAMGTAFVPEYGRTHYESRGGELDLDDYVTIAHTQREMEEDAARRAKRFVFVDTNAITTMFFSHYYNRDSRPELQSLADACAGRYRHVFVCDDDIPFEQDGWRDEPAWRARMQGMVLHDLAVRRIPYTVVSGPLEARVQAVTAALRGAAVAPPDGKSWSLGPKPNKT